MGRGGEAAVGRKLFPEIRNREYPRLGRSGEEIPLAGCVSGNN